ncbi:MAG TPA: AI-2E family transporter [Puia sp.]|nr:AI-2E family transporter [Puia sp.]
MDTHSGSSSVKRFPAREVVQISIQLVALAFLVIYCFAVLQPFIAVLVWAAILAVALYPLHHRIKKLFGGRGILAAVLIVLVMLSIFIVPGIMLTLASAREIKDVVTDLKDGKMKIPPPSEKVKSWPLVGRKVYDTWHLAATNLDSLIEQNPNPIKTVTRTGIGLLTTTGKGLLLFAASLIISGVFLCYAKEAEKFARILFNRLMNSEKFDMASIATVTIRNVVKGILGVALIQCSLLAIGLVVAGVPYAGVWTLLALILAIIQVGVTPVSIGIIIYIWTTGQTLTSILLTIWLVLIGLSDNVLKPILMGKGAPVPMLVVFLGSLGGFIFSGFVGLFTGAVILSLGYKLFDVWLKGTEI